MSVPLVIVEGFLGGASASLWGGFEDYMNCKVSGTPKRKVIFASIGPISSLHDRACELYYALTGGLVDYGSEHSQAHNHARFGRLREAYYPEWSAERPLHFLGHSLGGSTVVKLQSLISEGFFGPKATPDMILSINTVSTPFRGTQLVYSLGERIDAAPALRRLSVGNFISTSVHIFAFLSPLLPRFIDLHMDCRSLSFRDMSFTSLLKQLWTSDWAHGHDVAPYDATFHAAHERESRGEGQVHKNTFYRSYVASMTQKHDDSNYHAPHSRYLFSPHMYLMSSVMGSFDLSPLRHLLPLRGVPSVNEKEDAEHEIATDLGEEYWANDGVVPVFSQWHPLSCSATNCRHYAAIPPASDRRIDKIKPKSGVWHVYHMEDTHHASLVPCWLGSEPQRRFWDDIGRWLRAIDKTL